MTIAKIPPLDFYGCSLPRKLGAPAFRGVNVRLNDVNSSIPASIRHVENPSMY
jgi:hypothetical protein